MRQNASPERLMRILTRTKQLNKCDFDQISAWEVAQEQHDIDMKGEYLYRSYLLTRQEAMTMSVHCITCQSSLLEEHISFQVRALLGPLWARLCNGPCWQHTSLSSLLVPTMMSLSIWRANLQLEVAEELGADAEIVMHVIIITLLLITFTVAWYHEKTRPVPEEYYSSPGNSACTSCKQHSNDTFSSHSL